MKNVLFELLLFTICISSIYCQPDTTIYGITRDGISQELYLSKINFSTGVVTKISPTPFSSTFSRNALATIDPINKIFYLQSNSKLYGIDLITGSVKTNSLIFSPITGYFDLMSFNYIDTCIYGITRDGSSQELYLSKINPSTGVVTIISSTAFCSGYSGTALTAIDPINRIFYLQSNSYLYGIDLNTGNVKTNSLISTPITGYFELMSFNYSDTCIYGITRIGSSQELYLSKINPSTGVVTNISPTAFSSTFYGSALATIDPINKMFYLQSNSKLYGIDLNTGSVMINISLHIPMTGYFELMVFHPGNILNDIPVNIHPSQIIPEENFLQIFPNPAKDIVKIETNGVGLANLLIYSTEGLLISSQIHNRDSLLLIDFSEYNPGLYMVVLIDQKGKQSIQKLMIY
jgi:hypothetical protein